jgi:hypothetical protein
MTTTEILNEIQKLPLPEQRALADELHQGLPAEGSVTALAELSEWSGDELERREDEFERHLLAKGLISHIPPRTMTDEEFDDFELLELEGEPLSEQIIRERI